MEQDSYKAFFKAVAKGRFPKRAKNALRFLKALSGSDQERAYAKKVVNDLAKDTANSMTAYREKGHLEELANKKEEDLKEETIKGTKSAAATTVEQSSIGSRIREVANVKEEAWSVDAPSQEFLRELDEAEMVVVRHMQDANKQHKKVLDLKDKLKKEQGKKVPKVRAIRRLEEEVVKAEKELNALDDIIDEKREALHEDREKFRNYLRRSLSRYRAIKNLSKESGISVKDATNLAMLFFKQNSSGEQVLSIEGIETNPETGEAERKTIPVTINKVYFEMGKDAMEPDSPGQLMIEYTIKGRQEETVQASYKNFLAMVNAFEAHEVIHSTEEFNQKYAQEIGYTDVTQLEGQKFSAEIIEEGSKEGQRKEGFTVTSVKEGKDGWEITIDKAVLRKSRHELPDSMDPSGYFDRQKQTFNLGEFGAFLRQRGYQRVIPSEEMQETINRMAEAQSDEAKAMLEGTPDALKQRFEKMTEGNSKAFKMPAVGEEAKVMFRDDDGTKRFGMLRREVDQNGEDYFILNYNTGGANGNKHWGMPEISDQIAQNDPNSYDNWSLNPDEERIDPNGDRYQARKTKRISGRHFMEDLNKGNIRNVSEEEAPDQEPDHSQQVWDSDDDTQSIPSEGGGSADTNSNEPEGKISEKKEKIYHEALPYDDVYKVGGMKHTEENFMMKLWNETRFFSVDDFWQMGKAMWEYYDNRFQRRQKEKYSSVGQELPFWAPEMRRINQAAENEQVNQFKESFDQKGIYEIQDRLDNTGNRDELKASLMVLCEKGQMRWDDIDFWENLNRLLYDKNKAIPIPANRDPATRVSETDERTGLAFMKDAIDSLWGDGTYNDWYNQNKSTYSSNLKSYYEEGKELEGVEGGHARRLEELLRIHKNGGYVDPHEYEGLLQHSIEAGKARMGPKIYYMIEGIAHVNQHGRTILSFDRMAHINSDQLMKFPILEYLCAPAPRSSSSGEVKSHRFTIDDYKRWVKWFDGGNSMNTKPTKAVDKFMWEFVIPSDDTQNRINKDMRNGENLDHDDMFAYLPPATEEVITDSCKATTGSKKFLTIEGYANAFPGFSQYMRSLAENNNKGKLLESVKSFVRFEAIMTNRFEKATTSANDKYQRLGESTLHSASICSTTPAIQFIHQTNEAIQQIIRSYGDEELNSIADIIYQEPTGDLTKSSERKRQDEMNNAFHRFGNVLSRVVQSDNGTKMKQIIEDANFFGMPFTTDEEKGRRKTELKHHYGIVD